MTNEQHTAMMTELTAADTQTLQIIKEDAEWMVANFPWVMSVESEKRNYYKQLAKCAAEMLEKLT